MKPLPNPAELRTATQKAIHKGTETKKQKLVALKKEEERKQREHEALAAAVLEVVPDLCEKASEEGKSQAFVMALVQYRDYDSYKNNTLPYQDLKAVGAIVWNALQAAQLKPSIDFWYDSGGINAGFNLVVHW